LPSIHENNEELNKELSIYEIDNEIKNRCKFLYSCIANNGSRKCIVYCKDTEDMKGMMECMKTLNEFYIMDIDMNSISCEDSEKKRKRTLESFANNNDKIQLLFNIRILNECIDIPSCDSIYISYAPKNKITTIQRISRATRTDKSNPYKIANIYIWCEEYEEILETLSSIKEYDILFKDKIKVNAVDFYHSKEKKELELVENDKVLLNHYTLGIKEYKVMSWEDKLEMVEEYIKKNGKLPSDKSKDEGIQIMGRWLNTQRRNYKNSSYIMRDENIKDLWKIFVEKYPLLFRSNEEKWLDNLQEIEKYIERHNTLPYLCKDENTKKLARWIRIQKYNYQKKEQIMNEEEYRKKWEHFVYKYNELFAIKSNEEIWLETLDDIKEYITLNNDLPIISNEDKTVKSLATWICTQKQNYKHNKYIMKNDSIRTIWEEFIEENKLLFRTNEEVWLDTLDEIKTYVHKHKKLPSLNHKNLARWIYTQKQNYKNKADIMQDNNIRKLWKEFVAENENIFLSKEEIWMETLSKVKTYILSYNTLPPYKDIQTDSLAQWINHQKRNYANRHQIMKNDDIRQYWKQFIDTYPNLFITNDEIWYDNKNKVEEYIKQYNKLPSQIDKNKTISSLATWISSQKQNYKNKEGIMKNEIIVKEWECFVQTYVVLFRTNEEVWMDTFQKVKEYVQQNKALPSSQSKDISIKGMGSWVINQKKNFRDNTQIMKNDIIRNIWKDFIEKNEILFMSNEDIWKNNLNCVETYIIEHNILPSVNMSDIHSKKLGTYIHHQKHNYKNNKGIMNDPQIRQQWEEFIAKYPHLF
jgi:hypothetical protein